jgi:hypothetical protein
MAQANKTILDTLLSEHTFACKRQPVTVRPDDLAHVFGTQEPVRDHPDERARTLLQCGWLHVEHISPAVGQDDRHAIVTAIQQQARARLKQPPALSDHDREQVRWLWEKTRTHESSQQIVHRVWLAAVLHNLGLRGLVFDAEGQISYDGGMTARIGQAPDLALDLVWNSANPTLYAASFRQPDGVVTRGKGRHRWEVYCVTLDPAAKVLFERRARVVKDKIALIVASDIHATQPQLPRDFYGGDAFQQACIDAQDQHFAHILVLSPQHGVISLDDVVPAEHSWTNVLEQFIWTWQMKAIRRLGQYLYGPSPPSAPHGKELDWWAWLNPESVYEFTIFGGGFPVRILLDMLQRARTRTPASMPQIILAEQRRGYDVGEPDYDWEYGEDSDDYDDDEYGPDVLDFQQLMDWANEFVERVNIHVLPTGEVWDLAPDEALLAMRVLDQGGVDVEGLFDLLTDVTLLLEQPLPLTLIVNANSAVSILLQISHNLIHKELEAIHEAITTFPETALGQYVEKALQEESLEDQLCAVLSLAEQMHMIALSIPQPVNEQFLIWLQTYIAGRVRQGLTNERGRPGNGLA